MHRRSKTCQALIRTPAMERKVGKLSSCKFRDHRVRARHSQAFSSYLQNGLCPSSNHKVVLYRHFLYSLAIYTIRSGISPSYCSLLLWQSSEMLIFIPKILYIIQTQKEELIHLQELISTAIVLLACRRCERDVNIPQLEKQKNLQTVHFVPYFENCSVHMGYFANEPGDPVHYARTMKAF